MSRLILVLVIFTTVFSVNAKVELPDVISDNMVVQQKSYLKLWGKAKPETYVRVTVSWNKKTYKYFTGQDGTWIVSIKTPAAGFEPQTITFKEDKEVSKVIKNVLIGEVWFCSGQSNMEMTFKGFNNQPIENAVETINSSNEGNGIRMLKVKRNAQEKPVNIAEGKWMLSSPANVPNFSATAYDFALKLRKELNVPIGVINSSWGGTGVEAWMTRELVSKYADVKLDTTYSENENWKRPYAMFNGMVKPYVNYAIKGFIWYQGEGNVGKASTYADKLRDMVNLWRFEWKLGELPFYLVQIAPHNYDDSLRTEAAYLREAQFNATKLIPNSGIVCTNDLVRPEEAKYAHPSQKWQVGERLALLALHDTYQLEIPCYKSASLLTYEKHTGSIEVKLTDCFDGILPESAYTGFEIAGEDRVFHPATAVLTTDKNGFIVESPEVPDPVAVRYCFKNFQLGNVKNSCLLPLFPFRTDDWEIVPKL